MIVVDTPTILIEWDEKEKWLRFQHRSFLDGAEYRRVLTQGLEVMIAKNATKILWDLRKMRVLTPEDQAWAERDWTPRLLKESKVRRSAAVIPQSALARLTLKRVEERTAPIVENTLISRNFATIEEAEAWLRAEG